MQRKRKEQEFHDSKIGTAQKRRSAGKIKTFESGFYAAARKSKAFMRNRALQGSQNKILLDYCCGAGQLACSVAASNAEIRVVAIDISETSVMTGRQRASEGINSRVSFSIMDGENLAFRSRSFDTIACVSGLHHMDIESAYSELARVLKPDGEIICVEPLAYNPLIQLYRRVTPHLRTAWETEHILTRSSTVLAEKYFGKVETRFFHLATLAAAPFHNLPGFSVILTMMELMDGFLLRLPILKWAAWQVIMVLSQPQHSMKTAGQVSQGEIRE